MFGSPILFNPFGSNTQKIGSAAPKQGSQWAGKAKLVNICGFLGAAETTVQDLSIWAGDGVHLTTIATRVSSTTVIRPEMEFLDTSLTKDSSLLLHAIHSPFYRPIFKENHTLL